MKNRILIYFVFTLLVLFIYGCATPEEINAQIAEAYRGLDSLSYDAEIVRVDTLERSYTAYEFEQINEPPFVALGNSQTLTGSRSVWDYSVFIEKPDKKAIIGSGSHDAYISGGRRIDETWYFELQPAGTYEETRQICNGDRPQGIRIGCQEFMQNSIWAVPSALDDPTKFIVDITTETIDGEEVIRADIKSADGEFFSIGDMLMDMVFHEIALWFNPSNFKLVKFEGTLGKGKSGTETQVGLSTTYTMTIENMVFNLEIPSRTFEITAPLVEERAIPTKEEVSITVTETGEAPITVINAAPESITAGEPSVLAWQSSNVNSCIIKDGSNNQIGSGTDGFVTVSPTTTTAYTITCSGDYGSASDSVTVFVS